MPLHKSWWQKIAILRKYQAELIYLYMGLSFFRRSRSGYDYLSGYTLSSAVTRAEARVGDQSGDQLEVHLSPPRQAMAAYYRLLSTDQPISQGRAEIKKGR